MVMYLYAYKQGSASGRDLAQALGIQRIKHERSNFRGNGAKTVINWGSSSLPDQVLQCNVLNAPNAVALCSNKLNFFRAMAEVGNVNLPDWTTDINTARGWFDEENSRGVFCRTKLTGNSGEGIVDADTAGALVAAPLYTRYIPKQQEYRVHVFQGAVFIIQRKALKEDFKRDLQARNQEPNFRVRNLNNGFIFARNEGAAVPECVTTQAVNAFNASGLHFGSVDIVYNQNRNEAYVLEINTASGLVGTTLDDYVAKFRELM